MLRTGGIIVGDICAGNPVGERVHREAPFATCRCTAEPTESNAVSYRRPRKPSANDCNDKGNRYAILPASSNLHFLGERRAHVPLGAGSRVTHGFEVVVTEDHLNETAPSGYVARLVVLLYFALIRMRACLLTL